MRSYTPRADLRPSGIISCQATPCGIYSFPYIPDVNTPHILLNLSSHIEVDVKLRKSILLFYERYIDSINPALQIIHLFIINLSNFIPTLQKLNKH